MWTHWRVAMALAVAVSGPVPAYAGTQTDTGSLVGHVRASTGGPLASARVSVYPLDGGDVRSVVSSWSGAYEFADLPAGHYRLLFEMPGGPEIMRVWAHGKQSLGEGDIFEVVAAQATTVDETFQQAGTIAGQVLLPDGRPAAGILVQVSPPDQSVHAETTADAEGRYRIEVLPGEYILGFRRGDETQTSGANVYPGELTVVNHRLLGKGTIAGRLVDRSGRPVAGATVTAVGDPIGASARTDDNGEYAMEVLPSEYRIEFTLADGHSQWAYHQREMGSAAVITVAAGAQVRVDDVLIGIGSIAGRLTDPAGAAVPGYDVLVLGGGSIYRTTTTDGTGRYRVDDLPEGDYRVGFLDHSADRSQWAHGRASLEDAGPIRVRAVAITIVNDRLLPPGRLRILARDSATGAPLRGFCATVSGPSGRYTCTPSDQLTVDGLSAGPYQVTVTPDPARHPGHLTGYFTTTVQPRRPTTLPAPLQRGGTITALITDRATGRPVNRACVSSFPANAGMWRAPGVPPASYNAGCAGPDGRVRFGPVPPGTYTLSAYGPADGGYGLQWVGPNGGTGRQNLAAKLTVTAGGTTPPLRVRLDRAGAVAGTVTAAATGQPIRGGYVSHMAFDYDMTPTQAYVRIDSNGRYRFDGFGPYDWPLLFSVTGLAPQWSGGAGNRYQAATVTIRPGQTTTYNPPLQTGTLLHGTVHAHGSATVGGKLTIYNAATRDIVGVTYLDNGGYRLLLAGAQSVVVCYEFALRRSRAIGCHHNAADINHATPIHIPARGDKRLNITIPPAQP